MNFLEKCLCVELSLYQIVISFLKNRNRKPKGNKKNKNLQKNICDNAFFSWKQQQQQQQQVVRVITLSSQFQVNLQVTDELVEFGHI